ncbi:hypothetical protein KSS87_006445 [Heliosperma pusillum]|nr:hypothetical protein KSS87_006445 [Heliosperma pusillum]
MHQRQRQASKRPMWILVLLCLVSFFLICGYVYPPQNSSACYVFSSSGCKAFSDWLPPSPKRELTDEELASQAGHEGKFSVYVHASQRKPVHQSNYFINRDIRSDKVVWGQVSMIDAERRLLGNALNDPDNHHFVLLSDSCVPLHKFEYVYNYLMYSNLSYIDSFVDPGPHGNDRFSPHMLPEIEKKDFRKGGQWFTMKRQHALIVVSDSLYYSKFKNYCRPGFEGRNCYSDEHYVPTLFNMIDPEGMANWSVTHVDWSEHKWHPKSYRLQDVSYELLQNLTSIDESLHETSEKRKQVDIKPCLWNGAKRPCYLFARKFYPETLNKLTQLFSNYTAA